MIRSALARLADMLFHRRPPADERDAHLAALERDAHAAKLAARHALTERRRIQLAASSDDVARTLRGRRW